MAYAPAMLDAGLLVLVAFVSGAMFHLWWARRLVKARRRIPKHWPLDPRRIVNTHEAKVWRSLVRTFPDHHVMVKIPVTRFTNPRANENKVLLHELLGKVYCTFTICAADGAVIGCVDVRGPKAIPRSNQLLKLALLSQCNVCYWIVEHNAMPPPAELKQYFLGTDIPATQTQGTDKAPFTDAQVQLRAAVERQRQTRAARPQLEARKNSHRDSDFAHTGWQQPDSFIAPLDSGLAALH
jgi:hypothetical protein